MKSKRYYQCKKIIFCIEQTDSITECVGRLQEEGAEVAFFTMEKDDIRHLMVQEGVLFVTDQYEMARIATEKKVPVLFFLHDNNRKQSHPGVKYFIEGFEDALYSYFDRVYCRCKELPWVVMETERLCVREETVDDVEALYRIYQEPEITAYMEGLFEEVEAEKHYAEDYQKYVYAFYDFGIWTLEEKDTGKVIGRAGIEYKEELESDCVELGFVVEKDKQRRGYAKEACKAILAYAKEELEVRKVYAFVIKENIPSVSLLTDLGFQREEISLRRNEGQEQYVRDV